MSHLLPDWWSAALLPGQNLQDVQAWLGCLSSQLRLQHAARPSCMPVSTTHIILVISEEKYIPSALDVPCMPANSKGVILNSSCQASSFSQAGGSQTQITATVVFCHVLSLSSRL